MPAAAMKLIRYAQEYHEGAFAELRNNQIGYHFQTK